MASRLPQVKVHRPQASFLVWLDMRELGLTQQQVMDALVNKAHLALNNGTMFGEDGDGSCVSMLPRRVDASWRLLKPWPGLSHEL